MQYLLACAFSFLTVISFAHASDTAGADLSCAAQFEVSMGDVLAARRASDEFRISELRLSGAEADRRLIDTYYIPTFNVSGRTGKGSDDEYDKGPFGSLTSDVDSSEHGVGIGATQRLPGGATVELNLRNEWGRNSTRTDAGNQSADRSSEYAYELEARQPLLRGSGAAASADLDIGRLSIEQAYLSHRIFVQDDLVKSISAYSEVVSGRLRVEQAERSLKATQEFFLATQAQVLQGVVARSEVDQAQFAVSQSELELAYAQQAEKDGLEQLMAFSGLVVGEKQSLRKLPEVRVDEAANWSFPAAALEVQIATQSLQIARVQERMAKDGNKADVDLVASLGKGWSSRNIKSDLERAKSNGWRSQSYVGLELSKTLNDYPARTAMRKARLAVDEKQLELRDVQLRASIRRSAVQRGYLSARQYLQLIKKKMEVAEKNVANERFKIEAGRSTAFLVYSAQSNLDQAQSEYIDATSRYVVAGAELYKELGRLDEFVAMLSQGRCVSSTKRHQAFDRSGE